MDKIDSAVTDNMILEILGRRIRQERMNQNITQKVLAIKAGVGRIVVQRLEGGKGCVLGAFIKILRALGRLTQIDLFLPEPGISPLLLARYKAKERMRARSRSTRQLNQTE
jgi:predicted transcriptional regulator